MRNLSWYWHRFRAMGPTELAAHVVRKLRQSADARGLPDWSALVLETDSARPFPHLPPAAAAPLLLQDALKSDVVDILAGRWRAFGHLELKVDDPPRWQKDHLINVDLETDASAFKLNHRQQPGGADIKVIWEPSRWNQLARLAQAAYVLNDRTAADTCVRWLTDWLEHNPAYRGFNWTSALETGLRLVQFTWIDTWLSAAAFSSELPRLRQAILPAHMWYTWRYRSVGSSANNHLLGELAGLILAAARWPELARLAAPLEDLRALWEAEVLAQFASDGGNGEHALGYHLFSWEFCWQTLAALRAAGFRVTSSTSQRLLSAARFYAQLKADAWDFGDSDNAFVTPFFAEETRAAEEWKMWFRDASQSPAIRYWWGDAELGLRASEGRPAGHPTAGLSGLSGTPAKSWKLFRDSGYALQRSEDWQLRWDLSPLGFLATAAHGHLDALHVSIWHRGVAFVIDPGTGAYYADQALRDHLASWRAHNGPHPKGTEFPKRLGTFLWGRPHAVPVRVEEAADALAGVLSLPAGQVRRVIRPAAGDRGWRIEDEYQPAFLVAPDEFIVRWQFAPGILLERTGPRAFQAKQAAETLTIQLDGDWTSVVWFMPNERLRTASGTKFQDLGDVPLEAVCSPAFRKVAVGPYLLLTGRGGMAAATTFIAASG